MLNAITRAIFIYNIRNLLKLNKIIVIYCIGGIFGNLVSSFWYYLDISIGSSSSIFSIIGMNFSMLLYNRIFVKEKSTHIFERLMLLIQIGVLVMMSFFGESTDICGHLGGFIAGSIMFHRELIKEYCCFECQNEND